MSGWQPAVVDPRLAALRGEAASAGAYAQRDNDDGGGAAQQLDAGAGAEELIRLEDEEGRGLGWYPGQDDDGGGGGGGGGPPAALGAGNKGYQLLTRMGWTAGKGLGRNEDGILEPVKAGVEAGVRLGLGKAAQDEHFTNPELISRRLLESEIQAAEDEGRRARRELQVERDERIKADVSEILKTFYCATCSKQYANAMELEQHLSSYDHHHKKRLAESRALMADRTRDARQRKEQRAQEKEAAKLHQQIVKAQQQQQQQRLASYAARRRRAAAAAARRRARRLLRGCLATSHRTTRRRRPRPRRQRDGGMRGGDALLALHCRTDASLVVTHTPLLRRGGGGGGGTRRAAG
ncbi:MAG: hypothetical protein J3K34DRAFT_49449 [Monoraphidium minutum]|nr:MAG: hypothetical protein J3K34DRAFT_49449 [Monoraphidium minutum]